MSEAKKRSTRQKSTHQRSQRGPKNAPTAVLSAIPATYHTLKNAYEVSLQCKLYKPVAKAPDKNPALALLHAKRVGAIWRKVEPRFVAGEVKSENFQ